VSVLHRLRHNLQNLAVLGLVVPGQAGQLVAEHKASALQAEGGRLLLHGLDRLLGDDKRGGLLRGAEHSVLATLHLPEQVVHERPLATLLAPGQLGGPARHYEAGDDVVGRVRRGDPQVYERAAAPRGPRAHLREHPQLPRPLIILERLQLLVKGYVVKLDAGASKRRQRKLRPRQQVVLGLLRQHELAAGDADAHAVRRAVDS